MMPLRRASRDSYRPSETLWSPAWTPGGVISALESFVSEERRSKIKRVLARRTGKVTLVLDGPHDPHNCSAVLRSCDAFGVQRLHVIRNEEPFSISRCVARGSQRWVDVVCYDDPDAAALALKRGGFTLVGADSEGELVPQALSSIDRVAVVLGNEHRGIRPAFSKHLHQRVRIGMSGFVESLNLSVCAGILLHAITADRPGDLPAPELERLYALGLFHSVPRAREVLSARTPC